MGTLKSQRKQTEGQSTIIPQPTTDFIFRISCGILADASSKCVKYREADYTHDVQTLRKRLDAEGIGFATRTLPLLASGLLNYLESGESVYAGFKCTPAGYPRFLSGIFATVYADVAHEVKVDAINCIYQFGCAFKKMQGPMEEERILTQYAGFVEVDASLEHVFENLSDDSFETLQLARHYFRRDFQNWNFDDCIPKPGPGAVNTKTPHHLRYAPQRWFSQHQDIFPYEEWFYSHPWDTMCHWNRAKHVGLMKYRPIKYPTSRMLYVPKYYGTARGICIEENESQFLQQAVSRGISCHINKSSRLKGHIEFVDQSVNATLALSSSETCEDATIDMKDASDRVPRDIVSWVSQDVSALHNALMCLSTRQLNSPSILKGRVPTSIQLHKFAAMGSGLCFPVMALMHYYLIVSIIMRKHHVDISRDIYVYGDDIVLPSKYAQTVFEELPYFGMKLNRNKSFVSSRFRESCGTHAYNGVNITPVFIRKQYLTKRPDTLVSTFATEYLLFKKGLYHTAKCLRRYVADNSREFKKLPYVHARSNVVGWKRPASVLSGYGYYSLLPLPRNTRWVEDLQRFEYRELTFKVRTDTHDNLPRDCEGLLRWHCQNTENSMISSRATEPTFLARSWEASPGRYGHN